MSQPLRLGQGQFLGEQVGAAGSSTFLFTEISHTARVHVPVHTHDEAHFVLVVQGEYTTSAAGRGRCGRSPRLIFNPAGTTHRDRFESPVGRFFTTSLIGQQRDRLDLALDAVRQPVAFGSSAMTGLAARIFQEFRDQDELTPVMLEGLALELFSFAAREAKSIRRGKMPRWFARALELMHDRCCETISVRAIAAEVGVHPYHLARVSRSFTGSSPAELMRVYRSQAAIQMLSRHAVPLSAVALACGYSDQSQFTKSFRKCTGLTPGAFRKLAK